MSEKNNPGIPRAAVGSVSRGRKTTIERRSFFSWLAVGWIAFVGVTGGFFTVIIRYLFPNVLFEPPQSFKIGFPEELPLILLILDTKSNLTHGLLGMMNLSLHYRLCVLI